MYLLFHPASAFIFSPVCLFLHSLYLLLAFGHPCVRACETEWVTEWLPPPPPPSLSSPRQIKLVNIHSESLVEGKPTTTLGLVWSLILHFQVNRFCLTMQYLVYSKVLSSSLYPPTPQISGSMQPTSDTGSRPMSPVQVSAAELKKKLLRWAQAATEG